MRALLIAVLALGINPRATTAAGTLQQDRVDQVFHEKLLGTIPEETVSHSVWFSPDGKLTTYAATKGNKMFVMVGDRKGREYDEVRWPFFGPDGSMVVFQARTGNTWRLVVGEAELDGFGDVRYACFRWDGNVCPYFGWDRGWFLVDGQKKSKWFADVTPGLYAGRLIFTAQDFDRSALLMDGDGPAKKYEDVGLPVLSPDRKLLAYRAKEAGKWSVYVDGRKGREFEDIKEDPVFSPDGKTVAYPVLMDREYRMVVGEHLGEGYDNLDRPVFRPDGKAVAYVARRAGKYFVVNGGRNEEEFDRVGSLVFSPDGSSIAYWAHQGEKSFMVRDGRRGKDCDAGSRWPPVFSPDGKTLAYVPKRRPKNVLIVDEQERGEFDEIRSLTFRPDSQKLAFGVRKGREIWWKVIDVR